MCEYEMSEINTSEIMLKIEKREKTEMKFCIP
jgi:hypothetical protein